MTEEIQITNVFKEWLENQNSEDYEEAIDNQDQCSIVDTSLNIGSEILQFQISVSDGQLRYHGDVTRRQTERGEDWEVWDVNNIEWIIERIEAKERHYSTDEKQNTILLIKTPMTTMNGELDNLGEIVTDFRGVYLVSTHATQEERVFTVKNVF
ncbi:hypothetical protein HOE67_00715 [Candidatus Peregrinibacteria bacterium]|jgi:hypothetical protein|nr:hypothetical protein [Candidatus Peregrinibacteria bacterium]MBT4055611.1 hypothetical protein [Candidatus Peregrinibacteria bacterium]